VEGSGIKPRRDAQATAVGEDQFQGRSRFRVVVLNVDWEEGDRRRSVGGARQATA
jgi:hypothetical protein